jgi:hypothetical protein
LKIIHHPSGGVSTLVGAEDEEGRPRGRKSLQIADFPFLREEEYPEG